jgi:hypothetical protein
MYRYNSRLAKQRSHTFRTLLLPSRHRIPTPGWQPGNEEGRFGAGLKAEGLGSAELEGGGSVFRRRRLYGPAQASVLVSPRFVVSPLLAKSKAPFAGASMLALESRLEGLASVAGN